MRVLLLVAAACATATLDGDKTVTKVVKLLQGMLDKSKADGEHDREVYADFKCYCDKTLEEKNTAITDAAASIESMEALLADRRSSNAKLSQEVAELAKNMEDNEAAREEATTIRNKENEDFLATESDMTTGIDQLDRAIQLLQAVGADQTESSGADNAQLLAADATAAAKATLEAQAADAATAKARDTLGMNLLAKKGALSLTASVKTALREASFFLSAGQRKQLQAFIQAPGNYNAQSGEIVGVLKNMKDTFETNLASARTAESKAQTEYDDFTSVKETEYTEMSEAHEAKKEIIGNNAQEIADTSTSLEETQTLKAEDETFVGSLTDRCAVKKKQYEKRVMLRTNEEAAISQAISILHADDARDTFGSVDATSTGATSFLQIVRRHSGRAAMGARGVAHVLGKQARKLHSLRLARIAAAVAAENPFVKVLDMINKTVALIDKEQTDDAAKVAWCNNEKTVNEENQGYKETDIATLTTNLGNLGTVLTDVKANIEAATTDLGTCRDSQASETESRQAANAVFQTTLANTQEAEKILGKAISVLKKYYAWLHAHNADHSYTEHANTDSGGANIERLAGKSLDELKEACSASAECVAFNSAGWLKSAAPEEEWFDWDGGSLYVKTFASESAVLLQRGRRARQEPKPGEEAIEGEPETFGNEMEGQRDAGKDVVQMLEFIQAETTTELHAVIDDEREAQSTYESTMQALTQQEAELKEGINTYKELKAKTEKQIEEAHENKATTEREHKAIVDYLAKIEPDCTFYVSNMETRSQNREAEKTALLAAIDTIKGTPAFQAAVAAQAREDLGKCIPTCDEHGTDHAECLACQEGVSVFGYCARNGDAPGCAEATATSSADALALYSHKQH
jgi:hypothetical protein